MNDILPGGGNDFHHKVNDAGGDCVWEKGANKPTSFVCPRHSRLMRNNFTRTWSGSTDHRGNDDFGEDDDD